MKVYVTGATGMVGMNIQQNSNFKNLNLLAPSRDQVNLFNYDQTLNYLVSNKPDIIVHCAGRVGGIQANMAHPVKFLIENLDINRNLIMAAREAGIKKMLNLGSSCMYPRNAKNPLSEDLILTGQLEPTNEGYALAKITALKLCDYIQKEDASFQYKTLIPSNLYGRFDNFDPARSHLIPAVIRKLHEAKARGADQVEIWGDGSVRREFMFADELVECLYRCVTNFETVPPVMNIGLGLDYSINEYYRAAAEVVGYAGKYTYNLSKPVGMQQKLNSVDKLNQWGWKSKTSLKDGLSKTYQYFLSLENS